VISAKIALKAADKLKISLESLHAALGKPTQVQSLEKSPSQIMFQCDFLLSVIESALKLRNKYSEKVK
jgi:hypothetical protein